MAGLPRQFLPPPGFHEFGCKLGPAWKPQVPYREPIRIKGASMFFSLHHNNQIWFVENPRFENISHSCATTEDLGHMKVMTPVLPENISAFERKEIFLGLIKDWMKEENITHYDLCTDTCRVVPYLRHLAPEKIIFEENLSEAFTHPELFLEMQEYRD